MKNPEANLEAVKALSVAGFEAARSLGELNIRTWEKLVEKQNETFGLFVDASIELVKAGGEVKDLKELVNAEMVVAKQFGENLAVKSREALQLANDARDDYRAWAEQGAEVFTKQVNASFKAA